MKILATITSRTALGMVIACLAMMVTTKASAVTPKEVLRVERNSPFQGLCCFSWLEKVSVTEPDKIVPVIVTWSTDYQSTGDFFAGISVNGGPCKFLGSGSLEKFTTTGRADGSGQFESRTLQWLVLPSDGLVTGSNTFSLCGGAASSPTAIIMLGFNTLSVRISK